MITILNYVRIHRGVILLKIEKLNDKQIRCTLSKEDLKKRKILPSEIRYGSSKTKRLFNEVLKSAYERFQFSQGDFALKIEAVPTENDAVDILITKENFPEEMDTRFAEFSNSDISVPVMSDGKSGDVSLNSSDLYHSFVDKEKLNSNNKEEDKAPKIKAHYFLFLTMENLICAAKLLAHYFSGKSSLLKFENEDKFILVLYYKESGLNFADKDGKIFKIDSITMLVSDFDVPFIVNERIKSAISEHSKVLIEKDAVRILSKL